MRIKPADNASNQTNPNIDSKVTNLQYDQVHWNRGKQLNPTSMEHTRKMRTSIKAMFTGMTVTVTDAL